MRRLKNIFAFTAFFLSFLLLSFSAAGALTSQTSGTPLSPTNPSTTSQYSSIDQEITNKAISFCKTLYTSNNAADKTARSFCESTFISAVRDACRSSRTSAKNYTKCARANYVDAAAPLKEQKRQSDQTANQDAALNACKSSDCGFVASYINPAITALTAAFGVIAVISLILGGIQYSSSGGDPQKVSVAKKRIFNTIVAVFAYLFLYSFLQFLIPGGLFNRGGP